MISDPTRCFLMRNHFTHTSQLQQWLNYENTPGSNDHRPHSKEKYGPRLHGKPQLIFKKKQTHKQQHRTGESEHQAPHKPLFVVGRNKCV
jgi:hypothetical protein